MKKQRYIFQFQLGYNKKYFDHFWQKIWISRLQSAFKRRLKPATPKISLSDSFGLSKFKIQNSKLFDYLIVKSFPFFLFSFFPFFLFSITILTFYSNTVGAQNLVPSQNLVSQADRHGVLSLQSSQNPVPQIEISFKTPENITGPISLSNAIKTALSKNPMIKAMEKEVVAKIQGVKMAKAKTFPSISTTAFFTGGNSGNTFTTPEGIMPPTTVNTPRSRFFDGNLTLMYPVYTGGRLNAYVKSKIAERDSSHANVETIKLDVILMTKKAYRMAMLAKKEIEVYEELLKRTEEQLRIDEKAYEVGKIPQFYVLRDKTEVADTTQMLTTAKRDFNLALVELKTVMGIDIAAEIEPNDTFSHDENKDNVDRLIKIALDNRPEILSFKKLIESASAEITASKSAYKPQISVAAMQDTMRQKDMENFNGSSIGVVAALPIFDAGMRRAQVDESKAMKEKIEQDLESLKLNIKQEVYSAFLNLITSEKNIKTSETALESASEDYRIAKLRYESGKGILVELLDASSALAKTQLNNIRAIFEFNIAKDELERSIGGGEI